MQIELRIGKYVLSFTDEKTFWMVRADDGEGAEFDQKKLDECLDKFYNDNF